MRTYTELQRAIANWLMRQDMADVIPSFIAMAEDEISRRLQVKELVERRVSEVTGQYTDMPHNWSELRNVQRLSDRRPLEQMSLEAIDTFRADVDAGQRQYTEPCYYALMGNALELAPAPTATSPAQVEIVYFAKVPALTDDQPTNAVLDNYFDIYLFASLVYSAPFLKDDERMALWQGKLDQAIYNANEADRKGRHSGSTLMMPRRSFGV